MVDYSKWSKIGSCLTDSEAESEFEPPSPKVTRFDSAQRVTFGQGAAISSSASKVSPIERTAAALREADEEVCSRWTRNGAAVEGREGEFPAYFWSQTRDEVIVRFAWTPNASSEPKEKKPVFSCEEESSSKLHIGPIFGPKNRLEWRYEVEPWDTCLKQPEWQFEERMPNGGERVRYVAITVRKKTLIQGTVLWWTSAFKGHEEIKLEEIEDRGKGSLEKQKLFVDALTEAQERFKEKVRGREKTPINCD